MSPVALTNPRVMKDRPYVSRTALKRVNLSRSVERRELQYLIEVGLTQIIFSAAWPENTSDHFKSERQTTFFGEDLAREGFYPGPHLVNWRMNFSHAPLPRSFRTAVCNLSALLSEFTASCTEGLVVLQDAITSNYRNGVAGLCENSGNWWTW